MKKTLCMLLGIFIVCCSVVNTALKAEAAETGKKAIVVVSFGTTYADTRKVTIDAVTDKIKAAFPDYEVRQAFTSRIIIKRLAERDGLYYDTEKQALEKLKQEGYSEVVVQPLHIEAGDEYKKISDVVKEYQEDKCFKKLALGRPLLYYMGQAERPDDYLEAIEAIKSQAPKLSKSDAVVIMGHGGKNPANAAYGVLQLKILDAKLVNVFVFTVEGYPNFEQTIEKLHLNKIKKVTMMPFMLVAGDHANNDMAGTDKESYKSRLAAAGFTVDTYMHGLGENAVVQSIYVQHVKDAILGTYDQI